MKKTLAIVALVALLGGVGCTKPWQTARTTLDSLQAASGPVTELLGDNEEATEVLESFTSGLDMGADLLDIWEDTSEQPPGWQKWATASLETIAQIVTFIKGLGVPIPDYVAIALTSAQFLFPFVVGMVGG